MKRIGLLINPISGMGGSVGLKGTDGKKILEKAIKLGARSNAPSKAKETLKELRELKDKLLFFTGSGLLGEKILEKYDYNFVVVHKSSAEDEFTSENDSIQVLNKFLELNLDLIIFAGGDGTARMVTRIIANKVPCVAIPTGVKIHSPVFTINPMIAGKLALEFLENGLPTKIEEVVDLNEDMYRKDIVVTDLYGYLKVPYKKKYLQNKKAPTPLSEEEYIKSIALDIIDNMEEETYYLIGAGSTTNYLMNELGLKSTLLGVDIIQKGKLIKADCNEKQLLEIVEKHKCVLIISPTGGQGFLFGRGNQQISYKVLSKLDKEGIKIVSTIHKIIDLRGRPLIVYTGNDEVDKHLSGYYKVKTGYGRELIYKVTNKI